MFGLCLAALFALSALTAGPALAKKSKYSQETWGQYKGCDYENEAGIFCYAGITSGGPKGGFFQLGKVIVKLSKPITLQGSFSGEGEESIVYPAGNGFETLEAPELRVTGGLGLITDEVQKAAGWPEALKQSFKEAKKNKESAANVKIEVAGGNQLYETPGAINPFAYILEEGDAFKLPLKVRLINSWLEKLGGGPCTIGPVVQHLSTEGYGSAGKLTTNGAGTNISLQGSRLADLKWTGALASGCGGEYESYVNKALDIITEQSGSFPRSGITSLEGSLFLGERLAVKAAAEKGEL
jgi:hypothetical protein